MGKKIKKGKRKTGNVNTRTASAQNRDVTVTRLEYHDLLYDVETNTLLELVGLYPDSVMLCAANRLYYFTLSELGRLHMDSKLVLMRLLDEEIQRLIWSNIRNTSSHLRDDLDVGDWLTPNMNHLKTKRAPWSGLQDLDRKRPIEDHIYWFQETRIFNDKEHAVIWDSVKNEDIFVPMDQIGSQFKKHQI